MTVERDRARPLTFVESFSTNRLAICSALPPYRSLARLSLQAPLCLRACTAAKPATHRAQ